MYFGFLGVGMDVRAETALSKRYPQCQFIAADPDPANKAIIETLRHGKFVATAIGAITGSYNASLFHREST